MKRGYFVWDVKDSTDSGFAVVAHTAKEAKKIVFGTGEIQLSDGSWLDLRARWVRHAAVDSLPVGMVEDARDALIRGLYCSLMEYPCDRCGGDAGDVICHHGRALCACCIEEEEAG